METLMTMGYVVIVIVTGFLTLVTVKDVIVFFREIWVINFKKK